LDHATEARRYNGGFEELGLLPEASGVVVLRLDQPLFWLGYLVLVPHHSCMLISCQPCGKLKHIRSMFEAALQRELMDIIFQFGTPGVLIGHVVVKRQEGVVDTAIISKRKS
jgi:hypothetical protein